MATTPSTTRYDRFGRPAGYTNPIEGAPEPYLIKQVSATTQLICYYETGDDPRAIRRVVELDNETQICSGWGTWENAESAPQYPVNAVFEADNETGELVHVFSNGVEVDPVDPITAD